MLEAARPDEIGVSVSYPLPGTKFYELVKAQLGPKTHWQESNDLDMMFHGTYTSDFYRAVRNLLHDQISLQTAAAQQCEPARDVDSGAARALEERWQELLVREADYRSHGGRRVACEPGGGAPMRASPNGVPRPAVLQAALRKTTETLACELAHPSTAAPDWSEFEWRVAKAVAAMHGVSPLLSTSAPLAGPLWLDAISRGAAAAYGETTCAHREAAAADRFALRARKGSQWSRSRVRRCMRPVCIARESGPWPTWIFWCVHGTRPE